MLNDTSHHYLKSLITRLCISLQEVMLAFFIMVFNFFLRNNCTRLKVELSNTTVRQK